MVRLSVNVNKVAVLRNSRGGNVPDVLQAARAALDFGAHGITVHPRPDARHITYKDVCDLAAMLRDEYQTEFNVEGYPSVEFLALVCEVTPAQVTLVPDPPEVLTSNQGWDLSQHEQWLRGVATLLRDHGIRVSLFADPHQSVIEQAKNVGADRVELYTGPYANAFESGNVDEVLEQHREAARFAKSLGLGVNAGHDLNTKNLPLYAKSITGLQEVSIGHALFSDAIYWGLKRTIAAYLKALGAKPASSRKKSSAPRAHS